MWKYRKGKDSSRLLFSFPEGEFKRALSLMFLMHSFYCVAVRNGVGNGTGD